MATTGRNCQVERYTQLARINPLSYDGVALRALMLSGGTSVNGLWVDFGVLVAISAALIILCARLYPKLVQ